MSENVHGHLCTYTCVFAVSYSVMKTIAWFLCPLAWGLGAYVGTYDMFQLVLYCSV